MPYNARESHPAYAIVRPGTGGTREVVRKLRQGGARPRSLIACRGQRDIWRKPD
jgi:hypothetical protein